MTTEKNDNYIDNLYLVQDLISSSNQIIKTYIEVLSDKNLGLNAKIHTTILENMQLLEQLTEIGFFTEFQNNEIFITTFRDTVKHNFKIVDFLKDSQQQTNHHD